MHDPARAQHRTVAAPFPLPDWIVDYIKDDFLIVGEGSDTTQAEAMLVTGTHPIDAALLAGFPALKYICCLGSGYEGVDARHAGQSGIVVSNSARVTDEDVADHLVGLFLALCCRIPWHDEAIRAGNWAKPMRRSIRELKVGIFGLGAIGQATASRLAPFGPEIRWTGPRQKPAGYPFVQSLADLASWADALFVCARADDTNIGLIDGAIFDRLGPEGVVLNVSRGSILDEDALIDALRAGRLGGAALDVFQEEPTPAARWQNVPNIILSPHVGGYATGVRRGIQQLVHRNLTAFFAGAAVAGVVAPVPEELLHATAR
ncbi:MAG: NAD(P)-dependent oxidoreductase [Sphingobium sp.]